MDNRQSEEPGELLSSSDSSKIFSRYEELVQRLRKLEDIHVHRTPSPAHQGIPGSEGSSTEIVEDCREETNSDSNYDDHLVNVTTNVENQEQNCAATSSHGGETSQAKPSESSDHQSRLTEQLAYAESDGSDPEEAWKSFVFGHDDSDAVTRAAFEEAKHEATQSVKRPLSRVLPLDKALQSDGNSNMATVGTISTCNDNEISNTEPYSVNETSERIEVTYFPSSAGTGFDVTETSNDSAHVSNTGAITDPSIISDNRAHIDPPEGDGTVTFTDTSTSVPHATADSTATSLVVAAGSSEAGRSAAQFRFSQPKIFVGSRSNQTQSDHTAGIGAGITLKRKGRGRPKRRANDGRADIRALPNYSGDPIEDYDDERPVRRKDRKASTSLFQKLELV
ncbi:hypothetical protein VTH82DRAFT_5744 [Thermothelomyces myriococcoides]